MSKVTVLSLLVEEMRNGRINVVDLTQSLGPDTPVIQLPEMFSQSPGLTVQQISKYDDAGPAWYWNTLTLGEHTGTHFDAPVHWVTGKDLANNTTDTLPPRIFVGPACVIDVSKESAAYNDFILTREHVLAWEGEHGKIAPGSWLLLRTDWSKRTGRDEFLNADENGPHSPGFHPDCVRFLAHERRAGRGCGDGGHRRGAGGQLRSALPGPQHHARQRPSRAGQPDQPGQTAAHRCGRHRRR
ncbi:MAG: cyclase family protein [Caldilineaceae bacterium]